MHIRPSASFQTGGGTDLLLDGTVFQLVSLLLNHNLVVLRLGERLAVDDLCTVSSPSRNQNVATQGYSLLRCKTRAR